VYRILCVCAVIVRALVDCQHIARKYCCTLMLCTTDGSSGGRCHVLCHAPKKDYLRRLLQEPLPIESHLDHALSEHLNAEVVTRTVESKQVSAHAQRGPSYHGHVCLHPVERRPFCCRHRIAFGRSL
jgi:hypothetical protein